jgi:hypothetical protein
MSVLTGSFAASGSLSYDGSQWNVTDGSQWNVTDGSQWNYTGAACWGGTRPSSGRFRS